MDTFDDVDNNYTILHESSKRSYLIKINFSNLLKISNSWYGNRKINAVKVNELYESITDENYYIWTLVAVKELTSNELYIIDEQHIIIMYIVMYIQLIQLMTQIL